MKEVKISRGMTAFVDDDDFDRVSIHKWSAHRSTKSDSWYAQAKERGTGKSVYMHRLIAGPSPDQHVDHIDRNGLNNTRANLRCCSPAQNACNKQQRRSKTGFIGVYNNNGDAAQFTAGIYLKGRYIYGGVFTDAKAAALKRDELAKKHLGPFAVLNFPEGDGLR